MTRLNGLAVITTLLLLAAGCGGGSSTKDKCAGKTCIATQSCDPSDGVCKETGSSGGSGGSGGAGGQGGGANVPCNGACTGATPLCDTATQACVACLADSDCAATPNSGCDLGTHACVALTFGNGDTCTSYLDLTPAAGSNTKTVDVDLSTMNNDFTRTCSIVTSAPKDVVFRLSVATAQDVLITAAPAAGNTAVDTVVLLESGACGTSADGGPSGNIMQCVDKTFTGGTETVRALNLTPGTYFVIVQAYSGTATSRTAGPTDVTVTFSPPSLPPANDTCAAAQALTFDPQGVATASGSTASATNGNAPADTSPSCSTTALSSGSDVVFSYTLAAEKDVSIAVTKATGATFTPVLYVRSACGSGLKADELGCKLGSSLTGATLGLRRQPPGTYFLWVDGASSTADAFDLTITATDPLPPPANDTCSTAQALTFDPSGVATASGTTFAATNGNTAGDTSPSCSSTAISGGNDVVFSYTLSAAKDVSINVTKKATAVFTPVVYVRSVCDSGLVADETGCKLGSSVSGALLSLVNQPAGTYFLWVDSSASTADAFDLTVTTTTPIPPPANDTCATPELLTFTGTTLNPVTSTTVGATNGNLAADTAPPVTCTTTAKSTGADVVYKLVLAQTSNVSFTVTPANGSTLSPALYLRRTTCTDGSLAAEVDCQTSAGFAVGPATLSATALPAGDYYLWVDSTISTSGAFTLTGTVQ